MYRSLFVISIFDEEWFSETTVGYYLLLYHFISCPTFEMFSFTFNPFHLHKYLQTLWIFSLQRSIAMEAWQNPHKFYKPTLGPKYNVRQKQTL